MFQETAPRFNDAHFFWKPDADFSLRISIKHVRQLWKICRFFLHISYVLQVHRSLVYFNIISCLTLTYI